MMHCILSFFVCATLARYFAAFTHASKELSGVTFSNIGDGKFTGAVLSDAGQSSFDALQVRKGLNVIGDATLRKLSVTTHIDATSLELSSKLNAPRIDVSKLLLTNELTAASLRVDGIVNVTRDVSINGQAIVGSILSKSRVEARTIFSSGSIQSQSMEISGLLKGKDVEVENRLKVIGQLHSSDASFQGDVAVAKKTKLNEAEIKVLIVIGSLEVLGMLSCSGKLVSKQIHISGESNMTGPVYTNDLKSKELRVDGKAHVGSLQAAELFAVDAKITGSAQISNTKIDGAVICKDLQVISNATLFSLQAVNGKVTESLAVDGTLSLGGSFISKGDCVINATINAQNVIVDKMLTTKNLTVSNIVIATSILTEGSIVTENLIVKDLGIFESVLIDTLNISSTAECQQLKCKRMHSEYIKTTDAMIDRVYIAMLNASDGTLSGDLSVQGNIQANKIYMKETSADIAYISSLAVSGNGNIQGNLLIAQKLDADEIEVINGIKARSMFTSRVYTQDISASGFITVDTLINKGEMKVNGKADFNELEVESRLTSSYIKVKNSLDCIAATVHGTIDAGAISTRKATVTDELLLKGINISDALNDLEKISKRLSMLEEIVTSLGRKLDETIFTAK